MSTVHQYGPHPRQIIKVYGPQTCDRWIVFVHGGAWIDPRQGVDDGDALMSQVGVTAAGHWSAASVGYRLSPEVQNPAHVQDVIAALTHVRRTNRVSQFVLVGHSAGAWLALESVVLDADLRARVTAIICSEGIYDLGLLQKENPSYREFADKAFPDIRGQSPVDHDWGGVKYTGQMVLVQSTEDELLSYEFQTKRFQDHLIACGVPVKVVLTQGLHDQVFTSRHLAEIVKEHCFYEPK